MKTGDSMGIGEYRGREAENFNAHAARRPSGAEEAGGQDYRSPPMSPEQTLLSGQLQDALRHRRRILGLPEDEDAIRRIADAYAVNGDREGVRDLLRPGGQPRQPPSRARIDRSADP